MQSKKLAYIYFDCFIVWYIPNRIGIEPSIKFIQSYYFNGIKLLDSLFVLFLIEIAVERQEKKKYLQKRKELRKRINNKKELSKRSSFITDTAFSPKINHQTDVLGFVNFAKRIATEIKTVSSSESVVFGINGEWGEGKTSMINLIQKQLEDESYKVVNFHPWKTNSGKAMNQLFFDALKDGLKNKIWGINWKIDRYADALLQLDKTGISKTIWQIVFQPDSVEKQKDNLSESMKLLDKNIVVVVDDLDRLAKNEIADVLKLMRDTANFPNLVFLAAYDRKYLNIAIKEEINEHNYETYMDKIVLWEAPIYKPQQRKYVNILEGYFLNSYKKYTEEIDALMNKKYEVKILNSNSTLPQVKNPPFYEVLEYCFTNLREVKRFYNAFSFEFKCLEEKGINFHDFFCLALMKFKSKDYYNQFKNAFHEVNGSSTKSNKIIADPHRYSNSIEKDTFEQYLGNILIKLIKSPSQNHSGSFCMYKNWPLYFYVGNNDEITTSEIALLLNTTNYEDFKIKVNLYSEIINKFSENQILEIISESENSHIENCKRIIWLATYINKNSFYYKTLEYLRKDEESQENYSTQLINFIKEENIERLRVIKILGLFINGRKKEIGKGEFDQFPQKNNYFNWEYCIDTQTAINYLRNEYMNLKDSKQKISFALIRLFKLCYQNLVSDHFENDDDSIHLMRLKAEQYPDEFIKYLVFDNLALSVRDETEFIFNDFLLSIFKDKEDLLKYLSTAKFKKEERRVNVFKNYAINSIENNLKPKGFNVKDYQERTTFFEDLHKYEDFEVLNK